MKQGRALLGTLAFTLLASSAAWGFTYAESFMNSTAPGWTSFQQGTTPGPRLTSGATAAAEDPETGTIDTAGNGWLRLATQTGSQSNGYVFDTPIPSLNNTITVEFEVAMWSTNATGADGITFFMFDNSEAFAPGADGGSMAYAQKIAAQGGGTDQEGVPGGYVSVGIDNYGNYSNPTEGRIGGPGARPNEVVVRGQGAVQVGGPLDGGWYDGYEYLAGTGGTNTTVGGNPAIASLSSQLDFLSQTARPDVSGANHRSFQIELASDDSMTVRWKVGAGSSFVDLFTVENLPTRPDNLRLGFSGGTGGLDQVLELRSFNVETTGGADTWVWDNDEGNSRWGASGAPDNYQNNWDQDTNPTTLSGVTPTVVFSDEYISGNQTIRARDGDKTVHNMFFSGPHRYRIRAQTIGSPDPNLNPTIFLDSGTVGGPSTIGVFNNAAGNSNHRIDLDMVANNDVDINHFVDENLDFRGNFNIGSNTLTVNTVGFVDLRDVSGSGDIVKEGEGILYFRNDNTGYTGDLTVEEGIVRLNRGESLGSAGSGTVTVEDGATLQLRGTGNVASKQLTIQGDGVDGMGALRGIRNTSTWTGSVILADDTTIGADTGDTLAINGVISGTGNDLTIKGPGTTTLRGDNTYSGETIVDSGTLILDASSGQALGATTKLVVESAGTVMFNQANQINNTADIDLNGGTLDTGGNAQTAGTMTFSTTSTLVLGGDTLSLSDLVGTSGTLNVDDYTFNGQFNATPGSVDQTTLDSIFFVDQGILGAVQLANGDIIPAPEPSTYILGGAAALLIAWDIYRRRKKQNADN